MLNPNTTIKPQRNPHGHKSPLPLSSESTAGLNVPLVILDRSQLQELGDLSYCHALLHVLLVSKDQQSCFLQVLGRKESRK